MKKQSKKYNQAKSKLPQEKQSKLDAINLCKEISTAKFDESVEVAFSWGIDTKKPIKLNLKLKIKLLTVFSFTLR